MKKIGVNRIVFLLSLLFNVGAGFIYFQWVMNTYEINGVAEGQTLVIRLV